MNDGLSPQQLRQNERLLKLHFPHDDGPSAPLLVNRMEADEGVSRDFSVSLELLCDDAHLELKSLMGRMVTVELERADGAPRYFNGYVFEFRFLRSDAGYAFYTMKLGPWTGYLDIAHDCYLFHDKSLQDVLAEIFADYRPMADVSYRLKHPPLPETMRVQWDETDYNYLHRRIEEKGWHYWFEHRKDGHTLVISDDSTLAQPIDGDAVIRFHGEHGAEEADSITQLSPVRRMVAGTSSLSAFDFKKPRPMHASVDTINKQGEVKHFDHYQYAGAYGYQDPGAGDGMVRRRMEAIEAQGKCFEGQGNCRTLQSGRVVEVSNHFDLDKGDANDRRFLILTVHHTAHNNYLEQGSRTVYGNTFTAIRKHVPYRPECGFNSVQPRIYGLQTAIVVGPAGEEIHTDNFGRIRVQFHWDRKGKYDGTSSCWVRVASPWAGSNFGAISLPRVGQEVVVQWLDGNPDTPLVVSSVYNQDNMPPWDLPANKTQTGILSRSTKGSGANANALRFEDKKGQEEVWLHAERDQRIEVEHDESHTVDHDRTKTIGNDETVHVKHDRTETVDNNETITVHNNRQERVDHNETISIGDNRTEDVGKNETVQIGQNQTVHIGANRSVHVGGIKSETVNLAKMENVGLAKMLSIGAAYQVNVGAAMNTTVALFQAAEIGQWKTTKVGKSYTIDVADEFTVNVGKASFTMKKDGTITFNGHSFLVSTSGEQTLKADADIVLQAKNVKEN